MRIRMITLSAGVDGIVHPGEILDLPQKEAEVLLLGGYAAPVDNVRTIPGKKPKEK